MRFEFRVCKMEMDFEAYVKFLIQHQADLNMPYSFSMKLSFISSPLMMGRAILLFSEEPYQIVGAAGFVYGTGANDFEDQHVSQVEVAYICKEYRHPRLFLYGLQALVGAMKEGNPSLEKVQFWAPAEDKMLGKLFSKFSSLPGSTQTNVNQLIFYTVPFHELEAYCQHFA